MEQWGSIFFQRSNRQVNDPDCSLSLDAGHETPEK